MPVLRTLWPGDVLTIGSGASRLVITASGLDIPDARLTEVRDAAAQASVTLIAAGQVGPAALPTLEQRVSALESTPGGGGGTVVDATTTVKGVARLLGGTAAAPEIPAAAITGTLSPARLPSLADTEFVDHFIERADGAPPPSESGHPYTLAGSAMVIAGGKFTLPAGTTGAGYASEQLRKSVRTLRARFTYTAGDGTGSILLGAFATEAGVALGAGGLPDSPCHLSIWPNGWDYAVIAGGVYTSVSGGTFATPLAADDTTVHSAAAWIDRANGLAYVALPDGNLVSVSHASIKLAARWATWEIYRPNASQNRGAYTSVAADSVSVQPLAQLRGEVVQRADAAQLTANVIASLLQKQGLLRPTGDIKYAPYAVQDRDLVRVDPTLGSFVLGLGTPSDGKVVGVKDERSSTSTNENEVIVTDQNGGILVRIRMGQQVRLFVGNGATWTAFGGQDAIPSLDVRYTRDKMMAEPLATSMRALGRAGVVRRDPVVATPTITVAATVLSGLTRNHPGMNNRSASRTERNREFTYSNPNLAKFGPSIEPYPSTAKALYTPTATTTYGSLIVKFWSDAPAISIYEYASDVGTTRLKCDGREIAAWGAAIRSATAQGGGASTITLDTAVQTSSVNGFYNTKWIKITGGTGAGQHRQITGYVGATKVATVATPWTTVPDSTSTFSILHDRLDVVATTSAQYVSLDWQGERRWRLYEAEISNGLWPGIYTAPIDSVVPATPTFGPRAIGITDSGWYSLGGTGGIVDSAFGQACKQLGWTPLADGCLSGTGFLNDANGTSFTVRDRMLPPYNSWVLSGGGTGNFVITWGAISTAAIATTADRATIQTAVDSAFGAGTFKVFTSGGLNLSFPNVYLLGRGAAAASVTPVTVDWSGVTGGWKLCERWTGVVAPNVPRDGAGNPMMFHLFYAICTNDIPSINAAFTPAAVKAEAKAVFAEVAAAYPTARQWVIGPYNIAAWPSFATATPRSAEYLELGIAIREAVNEALPKIRGSAPLVEPYRWRPDLATTLSQQANAAATSIVTPVPLTVDQNIIIGSGSTSEARTVTAVSGTGPYTLTVAALTNGYAAGVAVTPYSAWFTGNGTVAAPDGLGSADISRDPDRLHPTPYGAMTLGVQAALGIDALECGVARAA